MNKNLWMNSRRWRLEEVDGGDEQYLVESHFAVCHTPPPVSTVALQHKSVSSVLRYTTPLPINRTPDSTVGGPFPPFCATPHPSRRTGSRFERGQSNTRSFPPFCGTPGLVSIACSVQAGWLPHVPLPPDEHDALRCLPINMTHSVASP